MLTLTIVILNSGSIIDIMVKPEQRIMDVIYVLAQNNKILLDDTKFKVYIRSQRLGEYINNMMTFKQANIFYGDILYVEVEYE